MHKLQISLTNDMLNQLKLMHESMERQTDVINEAAEKFNYVLLQMESYRNVNNQHRTESENQVLCAYTKTLNNTLTKIIENAVNLLPRVNNMSNNNLTKYLQLVDNEAEFLESNIRKLLVLSDIVKQMLEMRKTLESNDTDTEDI